MVHECGNCDKVYKTKHCLRNHINFKHSKVQLIQCVKCDKQFLNKYSLKRHVRQVHPSNLHSCTFCGSSYKASMGIKSFLGF